ncbi:uncharacterized protein MEPE_01621 [Melanopsichium pennsylvanicum]|uniref:Uncharacterized protein n=2 Tax=Melanopsichium pennsylvanicum TaxID=63383 RepID=A0AAJ4XIS3_9BASI|nr:putative protein [Melanopsichium pennsylvanicum 4]SNX82915.1 uncharacterized protein MEPE_01621 [Melanopsichium pennsylvanicum]
MTVSCSTSFSSTPKSKPAASSVRNIKRKPVPKIPTELLQQVNGSNSNPTAPTSIVPVLQERSMNIVEDADATQTKETAPSFSAPTGSSQRPQRQYILDIDTPTTSLDNVGASVSTVKQLLRSASVSPGSDHVRTRRGPLRWLSEKEEHTNVASTSSLLPSKQPGLSRKTSISAHLKLSSFLRNKAAEEHSSSSSDIAISGPTDFLHLSTGTENASATSKSISLRRSSTTSRASAGSSSLRSSMASNRSGVSSVPSDYATPISLEDANDDTPLYSIDERKHPLRPLKSIRRPSKLSLNQADDPTILKLPLEPTSPKDKRKAIYAAPGSSFVPAILEPLDTVATIDQASELDLIESSPTNTASQAGESFAAALETTLNRSRSRNGGDRALSPDLEPELSRSPSSGYESSNRSSLGSLNEFSSFLNFPDVAPGGHGASVKRNEKDVWQRSALQMPITLEKF